jgi:hypothetical protein
LLKFKTYSPAEDKEISALAQKSFEKQGIKIHVNSTTKALKKNKDSITPPLRSGKSQDLTVDRYSSHRNYGNGTILALKNKIKVEKGHIVTNEWCATAEPGFTRSEMLALPGGPCQKGFYVLKIKGLLSPSHEENQYSWLHL